MPTTLFDGSGLEGHDSSYVVETFLTIEPANSGEELPNGLWQHLLTPGDKFSFALVVPLPENN